MLEMVPGVESNTSFSALCSKPVIEESKVHFREDKACWSRRASKAAAKAEKSFQGLKE